MIKNITTGTGLQVNNSYSNWPSFYTTVSGTGNNLLGQIRYNGSSQNLEVYDGTNWLTIMSSYPTIELAPHVQAVVAWAQTKMSEEAKLTELANQHPGIQDLKEKLDIMVALVKKENQTP
jgi:hypothetical protein